MSLGMLNILPFDTVSDGPSLAIRWEKWKETFETAMVGFNTTNDKRKRALLQYYGGESLKETLSSLPDAGNESNYKSAIDALTNHFAPKKNVIYESIVFRRERQQRETIDQYCVRLRRMAACCDFHDTNREVLTQLIDTCTSQKIRRAAFEKGITNLENFLELARAHKLSDMRSKKIERDTQDHARVHAQDGVVIKIREQSKKCFACNGEYPHKEQCPAEGRKCYNCGRKGHLSSVCCSRKQPSENNTNTAKADGKPEGNHVNYVSTTVNDANHIDLDTYDSDPDYMF